MSGVGETVMKDQKTGMSQAAAGNRNMARRIAVLGVLCILTGTALFFRRGRDTGVRIRPERDYPVGEVISYCQKDDRWEEDKLGPSGYTMARSGCLTSCIASALSTEHLTTGAGAAVTAGELNQIFSEYGVYNDQGDIVWGRIEEALPQARVLVASSVNGQEIEELLAQGRYPAVKVKVGGNGAAHWVLLIGSENGEYLCMDPLEDDGKPVLLSRHGGVVYRMRCVCWGAED